jgi:NAD(P)-dependent dehydrogenase (short-subunit alcohol dehydrogenase family)
VVIGDIRREPREGGGPTFDLIAERGGRGAFVEADASRVDDIDRLVRAAVERSGRLDAMVNNAIVAGPHYPIPPKFWSTRGPGRLSHGWVVPTTSRRSPSSSPPTSAPT